MVRSAMDESGQLFLLMKIEASRIMDSIVSKIRSNIFREKQKQTPLFV